MYGICWQSLTFPNLWLIYPTFIRVYSDASDHSNFVTRFRQASTTTTPVKTVEPGRSSAFTKRAKLERNENRTFITSWLCVLVFWARGISRWKQDNWVSLYQTLHDVFPIQSPLGGTARGCNFYFSSCFGYPTRGCSCTPKRDHQKRPSIDLLPWTMGFLPRYLVARLWVQSERPQP